MHIDPVHDFGEFLLTVEKPSRYVGSEYGRMVRPDALLQTAIAFPDLYEIGMSNQALKILYNRLNRIQGISCNRVFVPAPDFEQVLHDHHIPLYGLDTGIPLGDLDLLLVTFGYELGITGVLNLLDLSGIPFYSVNRKKDDPIIIMGGPCVSNPLPYGRFADAFWIGEAEAGFFELMEQIVLLKKKGAGRNEILSSITGHPSVWIPKKKGVIRAVDTGFSTREASAAVFPVPNMKIVHPHGSVEIMRGCPNGCRFCHAGYWYRPSRQKDAAHIREEVAAFVYQGGYRDISLSSLSSGDYCHLDELVDDLHAHFSPDHVSFQLPSLKVSTFSLNLLEKISRIRKSGLTFAVETPDPVLQQSLNKEVSRDSLLSIMKEARNRGWHGMKFYFMIGLPGAAPDEEVQIVTFIEELSRKTRLHFNINVGTFVPKPHTPFQNVPQMSEEESRKKLDFLRSRLKMSGHKVSVQDPFLSILEGIFSRGGPEIGDLIEEAYRQGCRLDAWTEFIKKDLWRDLLVQHREQVTAILQGTQTPWLDVESGIIPGYFRNELEQAESCTLTPVCSEKCQHPCGICKNDQKIIKNTTVEKPKIPVHVILTSEDTFRILFSFSKKGSAIFHSHLSLIEIFPSAFTRARIPVFFSQGFNPLPRLEIAAPLSLGIQADAEIAAVDMTEPFDPETFVERLNNALPEGLSVGEALSFVIPAGKKKHSLASALWGFMYTPDQLVPALEEKHYRQSQSGSLERIKVLAKNPLDPEKPESYFEVYRKWYQ
ncbi:B12-binding protein [Spirochaetia bacterium]|nr:B12-binding protein [Spirochaetia bacterium]